MGFPNTTVSVLGCTQNSYGSEWRDTEDAMIPCAKEPSLSVHWRCATWSSTSLGTFSASRFLKRIKKKSKGLNCPDFLKEADRGDGQCTQNQMNKTLFSMHKRRGLDGPHYRSMRSVGRLLDRSRLPIGHRLRKILGGIRYLLCSCKSCVLSPKQRHRWAQCNHYTVCISIQQ